MSTEAKKTRMRIGLFVAVWALALPVALFVSPWFFPSLHPDAILADNWSAQLATAEDDQVQLILAKAVQLGDAGMLVLAEGLCCDRESVVLETRDCVDRQIKLWRQESNDISAQKVALFMRLLAARNDRLGDTGRDIAARYAEEFLLWNLAGSDINGAALLADCEVILRRQLTDAEKEPKATVDLSLLKPDPSAGGQLATRPPPAVNLDEIPALPGGGLAIIPADIPRQEEIATIKSPLSTAQQPIEPGPIEVPLTRPVPRPPVTDEPREFSAPGAAVPIRETFESNAIALGHASVNEMPTNDLKGLDDIEVMRLLHQRDATFALDARDELVLRGFNPVHIELAIQLTSADPNVRYQLVEKLPRITGLNATPWLQQLAQDPDRTVGRAAVIMLMSSNNPTINTWLRTKGLDRLASVAGDN